MTCARIVLILFIFSFSHASFGQSVPDQIFKLLPDLKKWSEDEVLIQAALEAMNQPKTLEEIQSIDQEWQSFQGISPFMIELLENTAARQLLSYEKSAPYFQEIFLTDRHGANIAMTTKTSDYWQGDEPKFVMPASEKFGEIYVSPVKFDESTQSYLVQVSVPIKQQESILGVIVIGINLENLTKAFTDEIPDLDAAVTSASASDALSNKKESNGE